MVVDKKKLLFLVLGLSGCLPLNPLKNVVNLVALGYIQAVEIVNLVFVNQSKLISGSCFITLHNIIFFLFFFCHPQYNFLLKVFPSVLHFCFLEWSKNKYEISNAPTQLHISLHNEIYFINGVIYF